MNEYENLRSVFEMHGLKDSIIRWALSVGRWAFRAFTYFCSHENFNGLPGKYLSQPAG
jgi:hypothetical protein